MRIKIKSIIVMIILFFSVLIGSWNFDLGADNPENEVNNTSISRSDKLPRDGNFDWGQIEVISEPIIDKNFNIALSESPKIAVENDKIYVVWYDKNNTNGAGADWDIFYRYFDGSKWSKIQVISEPIFGKDFNTGDSTWLDIVVENGKIYVVWQDENNTNNAGGDSDIFIRCNLTGSSWEPVQVISEPVHGKDFNTINSYTPTIAIENGKIYVVWCDNNNTNNAGSDYDIFHRCNLTGSSWEPIQVISEPTSGQNINVGDSYYPEIAVENGRIYIVWEDDDNTNNADIDSDIFYRCNLTGFSWDPIQVISEPVLGKNFSTGYSSSPYFAVENSNIYVVWQDRNDTNGAGTDDDIFLRCNLTGFGWEDIQVISEPISGQNINTGGSLNPKIAIENGKIYVVWCDNNNTNNAGMDLDIFYRCIFSATSWEDMQVISEPVVSKSYNIGQSIEPHIAVYNGKSHIVWRDENITNDAGTDRDIFYRNISLILGFNSYAVTPIVGNTSTKFNFTATYFHLNNKAPVKIIMTINGTEYSMLEIDPDDTNYIDGKDYFINIKNLDIGVYTCQFYASDGKFTQFTAHMNKPKVYNTPPFIITEDNLTAFEDVYYEVDYEYDDIDIANVGQVGIWSFKTNASWLEFNETTGILNATPINDDVGEYWVYVSVNDTECIDFTNFTLSVINVNDEPIIITNNLETAIEDELYEVDYEAIDVDTRQNNLIWSLNTNASWLEFKQTTAILNGTPTNDEVGKYWVNVSVNDTEHVDFTNFTLIAQGVNDAPEIITENIITATEGIYYEVDYEVEDVDNNINELIWNIYTNADWLAIDMLTAVINGTPTNDDVGEYWVYISVRDNEFIDKINFTLTVLNTNDYPMIITGDVTTAKASELYSVNYEATDIDPPPFILTWSLKSNASNWLTIDASTGWLNGMPSQNDVGSYWVNVSVYDDENGWDFSNFTLYVSIEPEYGDEDFKLLSSKMTPTEGDTETEFIFSIHYYNSENKAPTSIQLIMDSNIYNMTLKSGENASNGIYEYNTKLSEGIHTYYFTASNESETIKTDNFVTPYIKKVDRPSSDESTWYWLIWIVIIVIVIISIVFLLVYKKYKAKKIPTYRAELIHTPPTPKSLSGTLTLGTEIGAKPELPTPTSQTQAQVIDGKAPLPALGPKTAMQVPQLPQATLSRIQKLNLLQERFLRGEVSEEMYSKMRTEIGDNAGEEVNEEELEE